MFSDTKYGKNFYILLNLFPQVRELEGIPLILDNCNIDSNNPCILCLITEVDGLEIQTHLCLCTYISSLSKSLFIFMPRSHFSPCVSYPGTFRVEFGMFAQENWWVCNQKYALHQALIATVCAGRPTKLAEIFT